VKYLFETERLAFRNWTTNDFHGMHKVSSDPEVMKYFPSIKTEEETKTFIKTMRSQFEEHGYCYFPTILKSSNEVIGFIGLAYQTFEAPFNPATDIGWRLAKKHWGNGYATEGAKACLQYAFNTLDIQNIVSIASIVNEPSINVMKKIGMKHEYDFEHSLLHAHPDIKMCSLYSIKNTKKLM